MGLGLGRSAAGLDAVFFWAVAGLWALGALIALLRQVAAMACLGLALAGLSAGLARVQPLAHALAGPDLAPAQALKLQARLVEDLGGRHETGRHAFAVEVQSLQGLRGQRAPELQGRLRLSLTLEDALGLGPGDRVEVYGNLRGLSPPGNPGEFDYRAYALGQGLVASFSARMNWPVRQLEKGSARHPRRLAWEAKQFMVQGLRHSLSPRSADLAVSLALGDKAGLSREDMANYARAGLADLMAVSGAHFALVLALVLLILKRLTHRRRWQAGLGLCFGLGYALITGFEAPVQRAFMLYGLALLAKLLDLETDAGSSLATAALGILLIQPGALFEPGFQLSLCAAWAVLVPGQAIAAALPERWPSWLRQTIGIYMAAQWAVAGLLAWHFHAVQWVALLTPFIVAPFAPLLLGGALLLAPLSQLWTGATPYAAWPVEQLYVAMDNFSIWAATLPRSAYSTGHPRAWLMLAWFAVLATVLTLRQRLGWGLLGLAAAGLLGVLLWPGSVWAHRHPGETRVWALDVGQGDALLAEFEDGKLLLVDAGNWRPDMGNWVVGPALRALGLQKVDWAVVTHPHADHVGGLGWVMKQFPVSLLCHSGQKGTGVTWPRAEALARRLAVPMLDLSREAAPADWQGRLRLLGPLAPLVKTKKPVHDHGVVLELGSWLLLTGDLEAKGEADLVKQGRLRPVEVLKAGHHGSRSSSTPGFLKALRPRHALISCGKGNNYGHPNRLALERLQGRQLWRSDLQGCVHIVKKQGEAALFRPWRSASTKDLARPAPKRPRSLWRGLELPEP